MLLLALAGAAFCTTWTGGLLALRLAARMQWVLGFSAGAVVAVAFFDLLPEAVELGAPSFGVAKVFSCAAAGFLIYLLFDRVLLFQGQRYRDELAARPPGAREGANTRHRATLFASSLSLHSFLDGITVGFCLQSSTVLEGARRPA